MEDLKPFFGTSIYLEKFSTNFKVAKVTPIGPKLPHSNKSEEMGGQGRQILV